MRALLLGVLASAALVVSACGDDPQEPSDGDALLQSSDLSGVASTRDRDRGTGPVGSCGAFTSKESVLGADPVSRSFVLDDGDTVTSARISTDSSRPSAADIVDEMSTTIDDCVARTDDADEVTKLDLGDGATGYRSTSETSNGPRVLDRAYATAGDDHVVVISVLHEGAGDPSVSVDDLLQTAVERAG